jgi:hypothetical protein
VSSFTVTVRPRTDVPTERVAMSSIPGPAMSSIPGPAMSSIPGPRRQVPAGDGELSPLGGR